MGPSSGAACSTCVADDEQAFRDVGCAWFAGRPTANLFHEVERYCRRPGCDTVFDGGPCRSSPLCEEISAVAALLRQPPPRVEGPGQP